VALCAAPINVDVGATNTDLGNAGDNFDATCGFGESGDRVFRHVMTRAARLRVVTDSEDVQLTLRDSCAGADLVCADSFGPPVTAATGPRNAGDDLFIIASGAGAASFTVFEDVFSVVPPGGTCDPTSETALCAASTSCLGGPAPRAFTCTNVVIGTNVGDSCVEFSTDRRCGLGLGCEGTTCVEITGATSGTIAAALAATPLGTRVGDDCQLNFGTTNFSRFSVQNANDVDAVITAETLGINDSVVGAYVPAYVDSNAALQCVFSDADINFPSNPNGRVTFTVPARSAGEIVVWPYSAGAVFPFQLTFSSSVAVIVTPP
jgi:hypothetical protein